MVAEASSSSSATRSGAAGAAGGAEAAAAAMTVVLQRLQTATVVPALDKGNPPPNGTAWRAAATTFLAQMAGGHLVNDNWSVRANPNQAMLVEDDPVVQLMAKRAAAARAQKAPALSSWTPGKDRLSMMEVLKEEDLAGGAVEGLPGPAQRVVAEGAPVTLATGLVFYLDPLTDLVEAKDARLLRSMCWDRLVASIAANHAHLRAGVQHGDVARLMEKVGVVIDGQDAARVLAALRSLVTCSKTKSVPMGQFTQLVASCRQVLAASPMVSIADKLVREAVLVALDGDDAYSIEASMARMDPGTNTDTLLDIVLTRSRVVERAKGGQTAFGMAAVVGSGPAKEPGGKGQCYIFRDQGKCRFGDKCRFSHGVVTEEGKRHRGKPTGKCYECGGDHSITDCKLFMERKEADKSLKAKLATAEALVATLRPAAAPGGAVVGTMARLNCPPPHPVFAAAVWGSDE